MSYTEDFRAKATKEQHSAVKETCEKRGIHMAEFIREAVDAHLGNKDVIEEHASMIQSLSDRIKGQAKSIERLFAIDRIHKTRNWWQRLRNKQITGDDVDQNIAETEERRNKAIHGEEK